MKVLVAVASKHGATAEIAERIGAGIGRHGFEVDVVAAEAATADEYDVAVVGSGAYAGQWLKPARRFVDENEAALAAMPVWLFSSGPLGDPLKPEDEQAVNVEGILAATGAKEHRLFAGALDRDKLSFGERAIIRAVRAPDGDFRDWDAIDAWAAAIAQELWELSRQLSPMGTRDIRPTDQDRS